MSNETYTLIDPSGTVVHVTSASRRDALMDRGYISQDPEDEVLQSDGLDDMKFDELKAVATAEEVSMEGVRSKAALTEAIRAKRAELETNPGDGDGDAGQAPPAE